MLYKNYWIVTGWCLVDEEWKVGVGGWWRWTKWDVWWMVKHELFLVVSSFGKLVNIIWVVIDGG